MYFEFDVHRYVSGNKPVLNLLTLTKIPRKRHNHRSKPIHATRSKKKYTNEPRHDKTNKMSVRLEKTWISMGIHPVWSVFAVRMKKAWVLSYLLSAQRRLIRLGGCPGWSWVFPGCTVTLLVLSCRGSNTEVHRKTGLPVDLWAPPIRFKPYFNCFKYKYIQEKIYPGSDIKPGACAEVISSIMNRDSQDAKSISRQECKHKIARTARASHGYQKLGCLENGTASKFSVHKQKDVRPLSNSFLISSADCKKIWQVCTRHMMSHYHKELGFSQSTRKWYLSHRQTAKVSIASVQSRQSFTHIQNYRKLTDIWLHFAAAHLNDH